ncbi:hypothetical protein TCAL_07020 [Tigriopus californicus]|uniref:MAM domain-containing protein n=1 Tax=Tigriopus californicus TaxID=6832 RepID=A0A553PDM6_TIGCA|nr:hypothetical protein TCAL_07020 [Tigriopus californicus]
MILGHVSAKIDTPVFRLILLMVCIQCTLPHLQVQGFNLQDLFHPLVSAKRFLFPSQMTSELHQSRIVKRSPADPEDNGSLIWECTFPRREILAPRTNGSGTPPLLPPATPSSFQPPDHNLCNFTLDVSRYGLREWSPGSGLESLWMGGPKSDAQASRYVFYDTSKFYERNEPLQDRAWILSPWTPRSQVKGNCLNFKHASQGLNIGSLNLIRIDLIGLIGKSGGDTAINETSDFPASNPEERTIHELLSDLDLSDAVSQANEQRWARSASLNNYHFRTNLVWSSSDMTNGVWDRVHYSYATPSNHVFAWEVRPDLGGGAGDVRNVFNGYVAIDDIVLKAGECEDECNFNADFCQFSNDEMDDDDFDWSLSRGSLKPGTGPMMDQSATTYGTRTGGYAYLDSGFPRRPGDTARLTHGKAILSPSQRKPLCVSFWVNLYGSGLGSLRVYARPLDHVGPRLDPEFLMWEVDHPPSSPRDVWTQAKFTLANLGNMTKLVFEGVIGEVDRSDIAIDTVQIQPGPCP